MGKSAIDSVDLNLIAALVVLVEERSTVAAARRMRLAQSTVSGILAKLRHHFDDPLLVRNGRHLEPTMRALELVEAAGPHMAGLAQSIGELTPFRTDRDARIFRLGCTDAVAMKILPDLTQMLRREAPFCSLVVRSGDYRNLPAMLASGEISTAVGYLRESPPASAKIRVLRHSPWVAVRATDQPQISGLDDFCARPHTLVSPRGDLSGFVDDALEGEGKSRSIALVLTSFALLLTAIPGSDLIATVPDFVANRLQTFGDIAVDPCPVEIPLVTNSMAWRAVVDRDPGERWLRERIAGAFQT